MTSEDRQNNCTYSERRFENGNKSRTFQFANILIVMVTQKKILIVQLESYRKESPAENTRRGQGGAQEGRKKRGRMMHSVEIEGGKVDRIKSADAIEEGRAGQATELDRGDGTTPARSSGATVCAPKETATPEKNYAYFLSHKKQHSMFGGVPAQIAKNIHDSLQLLGHHGWMDIDNLAQINEAHIREGIQQCESMIILINDETWMSEWCVFEWQVAKELCLPVKIVVDMERCSKALALKKLGDFPHLLTYQFCELTERHRRDCLAELSNFLSEIKSVESTSNPR